MSKTQPTAVEAHRRFKERNGYEYGKGPSIQECNQLVEKLKEGTTAVTPGQTQVVRTALGKDFLSLVEKYRALHKCSKADAMMAVNKSPEGQAARMDYVKAANSDRAGEFFERAPETTAVESNPPDYMEAIEARRDKTGCSFVDAAMWVNAKHPGAREAYLRKMNPHLQ